MCSSRPWEMRRPPPGGRWRPSVPATRRRERAASLRGQLETLRYQLTDAESTLESLSQDQSDAARQTEILTGRMAANKTDMAALEAERRSATENVERLESLCASLEGDRAQKLAILEATEADTARIQEDLDG